MLASAEKLTPNIDQVIVDNLQGVYLAGQYLLRLNHRRIECITYALPHVEPLNTRVIGFQRALSEVGIELTAKDFVFGNGRYESGYKAMQELM